MATIEITTGISTTKKSAQSKKCRLLAKVAARTVNYKVALAIRSVDPLLADVMSEAEVRSAWDTGLRKRSSAGGSKSSSAIKLTIEIDDDEPESEDEIVDAEWSMVEDEVLQLNPPMDEETELEAELVAEHAGLTEATEEEIEAE